MIKLVAINVISVQMSLKPVYNVLILIEIWQIHAIVKLDIMKIHLIIIFVNVILNNKNILNISI